jgi:hypothetical protein
MHYQVWYSAHIAGTHFAESNGTIVVANLRFGAVLAELKKMVLTARQENILPLLRENIESSLTEDVTDRMAGIDAQIKKLQHELLATADIKNPGDDIGMEIRRLRNEKQALQAEGASDRDLKTRIDEMMRFLNDLPCELTEYEEDYVRTLLEKITVYDNHIFVEFKSGIEIQIDE